MAWPLSGANALPTFVDNGPPPINAATLNLVMRRIEMLVNEKINVTDPTFGAVGDGRYNATGVTATSGVRTITVTGGSPNFTTAANQGDLVILNGGGLGGVPLVTTIQSVNSTTSIDLATIPQSNITGGSIFWGTDNTTALQGAWDAAPGDNSGVSSNIGPGPNGSIIFYPPGTYLTKRVFSNKVGLTHIGSGRPFIGKNAGALTAAGTAIVSAATSGACFDIHPNAVSHTTGGIPDNWSSLQTGVMFAQMGIIDGTLSYSASLLQIQYMTRWIIDNCYFALGADGVKLISGQTDVSWGNIMNCSFLNNTRGIYAYGDQDGGTGAMAIEVGGGNMNVGAQQTGIQHNAGGYFRYHDMKFDGDGAGHCAIRLDVAPVSGILPNKGSIHDMQMEHTNDTGANAASRGIELLGCQSLHLSNIAFGGGGTPKQGTALAFLGNGSANPVQDVKCKNITLSNWDRAVWFGANSRDIVLDDLSASGIATKIAQWDSGSSGCRIEKINAYNEASDPVAAGKLDISAGSGIVAPYYGSLQWRTGGGALTTARLPHFAGVPSYFGSVDDFAVDTTGGGNVLVRKTAATTWAAV